MRSSRRKHFQKIRKVIGIHSCLETLKVRPKKIRSIYVQTNWKKSKDLSFIAEKARQHKIDFFELSKAQLASWGMGHQGAALIVEESPRADLSKGAKEGVFIFIDGSQDPRNLGAVLRTAWLMGVLGVFLPEEKSIQKLTALVCKTASGGAEYVPVEFLKNPALWLSQMKKKGFHLCGLDPSAKLSLFDFKFKEKTILIFGSEDRGLRSKTKSLCDHLIRIPQTCPSGSYNLAAASALTMGAVFQNKIFF